MYFIFSNRTFSCLAAFTVLAIMYLFGLFPAWFIGIAMIFILWLLWDQESTDYNDDQEVK